MKALISRFEEQLHAIRARDVDCIILCLTILDRAGILPHRGEFGSRQRRMRTVNWLGPRIVCLQMAFMTLVVSPLSVYMFWKGKLTVLMSPIISMFWTGLGLVDLTSLLYRADKFYDMVDQLHTLRACRHAFELPEETAILFKLLSRGIIMHLVALFGVTFLMATIGAPSYFHLRLDIFEYYFPYEQKKTPNYEIGFIFVFTVIITISLLNIVVSSLIMACLLEAFRQLRLLNYNLANVFPVKTHLELNGDRLRSAMPKLHRICRQYQVNRLTKSANSLATSSSRLPDCEATRLRRTQMAGARLKLSVFHHEMIIKFVKCVEDAFQPYLTQQYICTIFPVVLVIVYVTHDHELDFNLVIYLVLLVAVTCHQMVLCWLSMKLTDEDEAVRLAAYSMDWFDANEDVKRSLRIILSRSNQPLVIKVVGMIPLNMETFYNMMNATYTYYMSLVTTMRRRLN